MTGLRPVHSPTQSLTCRELILVGGKSFVVVRWTALAGTGGQMGMEGQPSLNP
jgi:hypothetical protein